jgi:mono/diheme cytochrome c family protein
MPNVRHQSRTICTALLATAAILSTALLTGCHSTPPPTPLDQLTPQQRAGYDVFQTRCAVCHNERTADAKNGPPLLGLYKHPYLPSGAPANDDRVTATILHGHGLMPAQPNLDPDALNALLVYLHTV